MRSQQKPTLHCQIAENVRTAQYHCSPHFVRVHDSPTLCISIAVVLESVLHTQIGNVPVHIEATVKVG